jgi:nicotinate phosphoribosyltransferase
MLQGYFDHGMRETAVFEFFVRKLPAKRNFLLAAGLEQVLAFLETLQFTPTELEWIAGHGAFRPAFVRSLEKFRFSGDVDAMAEGTLFFQTNLSFA